MADPNTIIPAIQKDLDNLVENVLLKRLANGAIALIRKRTLQGEFIAGDHDYSTKPFAMPVGGLTKMLQNRIIATAKGGRGRAPDPNFQLFTSKSGHIWVVVKQGYKKIRELAGKQSDHVTMTWTGRMMRNMGIVNIDHSRAEIGFTSGEEEQKAVWHNLLGAGKSRRIHKFMYLTEREIEDLLKESLKDISIRT